MEYFIGIDVSLEASSVCVIDQGGAVLKETKVFSGPDALIILAHGLGHEVSCIGMAAGPLSQWLYQHLTEAGHRYRTCSRRDDGRYPQTRG